MIRLSDIGNSLITNTNKIISAQPIGNRLQILFTTGEVINYYYFREPQVSIPAGINYDIAMIVKELE